MLRPAMPGGGLRASLISSIVTAIGALVLTLLLLEDPLVEYRLNQLARQTAEDALERAGELLETPADADRVADDVGADLGVRITIIDPTGRVVGDTGYDGAMLADAMGAIDHEALAAFEEHGRRYAVNAGRHVAFREHPSGLVLQASLSTATGERVRVSVRELLIIGGVMAVLVAIFLTLVLSRTLIEPAREVTEVADALATGDLSARTRSQRDDELGAIGRALDRMADQLEERIEVLRAEQDRLRTILDSMVEAVFVTDPLGRIELTNAALDALVEGDARGRTAMEAIRSPELHEAVRAARKGEPRAVELELLDGDERLYFAAVVSPLADRAGVVAVLHDVTRSKAADRIRRDFVANASHELRTPLTAIRGFAETLREGALDEPEAAKRFLDVILRHTLRLQALVADLATLSKAESPDQALELAEVDADAVIVEVVRGLGSKAAKRDVQLIFEPGNATTRVRANERGLDQVMINLVDNAIKYAPEGSAVHVRSRESGTQVVLEVHNPGPGIPPQHLPRIFERFYRVDTGRSRDVGGTGLGLAIVKHLCSQMGAEVVAESRPGEGVTFRVTLDRAEVSESDVTTSHQP